MPLVAENAEAYNYDFSIDSPKCKEDPDKDDVPLSCDNADDVFNPGQEDIDNDGVGDVVDLCPMAGGDANNTADSDNDGVGDFSDTAVRDPVQVKLLQPSHEFFVSHRIEVHSIWRNSFAK